MGVPVYLMDTNLRVASFHSRYRHGTFVCGISIAPRPMIRLST